MFVSYNFNYQSVEKLFDLFKLRPEIESADINRNERFFYILYLHAFFCPHIFSHLVKFCPSFDLGYHK